MFEALPGGAVALEGFAPAVEARARAAVVALVHEALRGAPHTEGAVVVLWHLVCPLHGQVRPLTAGRRCARPVIRRVDRIRAELVVRLRRMSGMRGLRRMGGMRG